MEHLFKTENCVLCDLHDNHNFLVKEVMLFKAISEYIDQIDLAVDLGIVSNIFTQHPDFSKVLKNYFITKFSPDFEGDRNKELSKLDEELDKFTTVGEISNLIINVVKNITRTNYFLDKEGIAFKLEVKQFKHLLRGLQPNHEIFVYHPEFKGLHLRMTHVSRGGLRWSERGDFREEIKSLMITQDGKNSIIVPAGAKGGFFINHSRENITKEMFKDFYSKFIHNLLDLVDNRVDGKIVPNKKRILKYDENDTYFVVAADKGTAQMSDVANGIAVSRNFWLGDAFASGGSNGYSHKDLGITAKGAFVSTERFFIEKGINFYETPIAVTGIGSMNGDVFGNGILLSDKFKLVGAFSHREIFIDPNPNPEKSFEERKRLFNSSNGAWNQYNRELISKGGGVFQRKDENIPVSSEMAEVFGIETKTISGNDLIRKILTAKVDLLFNGGVGTYVKASTEEDTTVGDYGNSKVRVDAKDLGAFAVCEGGNLGFTQKGRVEYALNGGKINLDAIDNSAGVNTSDHEVNIKILFSLTNLSDEEKSELLKKATDEVVEIVLDSNYKQALGLSLDEVRAKTRKEDFVSVIGILEKELPQFNREYFAIADDENFEMNRPNLSFLFSYSKILLKKILIRDEEEGNLLDSFFSTEYMLDYFPPTFDVIKDHQLLHPLEREIIGTVLSDGIINSQGVTFMNLLKDHGEDEFRDITARYLKIGKTVNAKAIRKELGKSAETYEKLVEFEAKLLEHEKSLREFAKDF
ncbi:NAD-specific glutamate dehydrogenase [Thiovulum sp. ES]|nr:NAD-specific glutamate dehydrogenase [Thiovulum sp. ES]